MRFEFKTFFSRSRSLHLKPGLDATDPNLKPFTAQALYIHQRPEEFFNAVENKVAGKILSDIDFILKSGWAEEISTLDFCHGHICGKSQKPIFKMDDLFSVDNILILYHTHEKKHPTISILSSLQSQPTVAKPKVGYDYADASLLGLMDYANIHFSKNPEGSYKLKDGTKLDMWGVLYKEILHKYLEG